MQSLTKRAVQETLKAGSRTAQTAVRFFKFAQPAAQQATSALNLTSNFNRSFSENTGSFEKVTSYESLISKICNASNVNDLFNTMNQNIALYKNEHIVLTLRVLARLMKTSNSSQIQSLNKDERYKLLINKAKENLEDFNEYEVLDFLFWLRRFKNLRLPTFINDESLNKLYKKVRDFVKSKSFNFRNLVNLYYDLSFLGKNTDDIAAEILNEVKADFKLLTPFTIVQILQACSRKSSAASLQEFQLADYVQRNLESVLPEFDSDQKCLVFKYLSILELQINPPKYRLPNVLYKLKNQLKEILDQLSELGVTNILDAYGELPKEYPNDLLDEIKEMVIATIQHNSENIKSFFLIDFLDKILNLPRYRKPTDDKIIIIYEEITRRILNDEFSSRIKTLERLLEVYDKAGIQYEPLLEKILQRVNEFQGTFFSANILRNLNKNGKDITPALDKYAQNVDVNNLNNFGCFQLFLVLSEIKSEKYNSLSEQLKTKLLANPESSLLILANSSPIQIPNQFNLSVEALFQGFIDNASTIREKISEFSFFKFVFLTIGSKTTRHKWLDWFQQNIQFEDPVQVDRFVDSFFKLQEFSIQRVLFFTKVLEKLPNEKISFRKLLLGLRENKQFLIEFNRNEQQLQRFLLRLLYVMESQPAQVRTSAIYTFLKRAENLNIRSPLISTIVKRAYDIIQESNPEFINFQLDLNIALYLIDHRALKLEYARQVYERNSQLNDIHITSKLLAYIVRSSPPSYSEQEDVKADVQNKLETLKKSLSETGAKTVLTSLANIFAFSPTFLENDRDLILKTLKSFLNFGTSSLYSNLVHSLPDVYVKENYVFYSPIIRELITNYNNFNKLMNPAEIVKILNQFSRFGTRSPTIYNYILVDIGRLFNAFKSDELASILVSISRLRIKQTDLCDRILTKIIANPARFTYNWTQILQSFFQVGFQSTQAKSSIVEVFNKISKTPTSNLTFALYISILNLENEAELFAQSLEKINLETARRLSKYNLLQLYEYLRIVHKDKPELAEKVKSVIHNFDETLAKKTQEKVFALRSKELIGHYLRNMKVDYQTDFSIDGCNIDLYLPSKKTLIKIFKTQEVNFDKVSLNGSGLLEKRIYQSLGSEYNTAFINIAEFKNIPEHMNRINYLIASGIQNNNTEGTYDFSAVTLRSKEDLLEEGEKEEGLEESTEEGDNIPNISEVAEVEEEGSQK